MGQNSPLGAVPDLTTTDNELARFAQIVKSNLDWMTGQASNAPALIDLFDGVSTTSDIIKAVNALNTRFR